MAKKFTSTEIRGKADRFLVDSLTDLVNDYGCELNPHELNNQQDRGIDYIFEFVDKSRKETVQRVSIQNKGSLDPKEFRLINNKTQGVENKISWQLKLRNVKHFYYEINEPLLLILCDLFEKKIYWYPIQIDKEIENRIEAQDRKNKKSIQVYVSPENLLTKESLPNFIRDITESERIQNEKHSSIKDNKLIKLFTKQSLPEKEEHILCLLYTSPSPRDLSTSRMPSSA